MGSLSPESPGNRRADPTLRDRTLHWSRELYVHQSTWEFSGRTLLCLFCTYCLVLPLLNREAWGESLLLSLLLHPHLWFVVKVLPNVQLLLVQREVCYSKTRKGAALMGKKTKAEMLQFKETRATSIPVVKSQFTNRTMQRASGQQVGRGRYSTCEPPSHTGTTPKAHLNDASCNFHPLKREVLGFFMIYEWTSQA